MTRSVNAFSTLDVASILPLVCSLSSGRSVIHRNVASGSGSALSSPCRSCSITAVIMTVFPDPVGADKTTACKPTLPTPSAA